MTLFPGKEREGALNLRHVATLAALVAALGCGAQPPGVVETGSKVTRNGCTVDLKQICHTLFDQPEFTVNGVQYVMNASNIVRYINEGHKSIAEMMEKSHVTMSGSRLWSRTARS